MTPISPADEEFLNKLESIVHAHLSEEQYGVSELAEEAGMSRSNLLRKVKKIAGLSVSQYIRKIRLEQSLVLLKESSMNVSEIGYKVGFSSTSYFIKCFREQYGYSPGEAGKISSKNEIGDIKTNKNRFIKTVSIGALIIITLSVIVKLAFPEGMKNQQVEKSIVVLPFINDSNDSTNVYLINGLMESTLSNLQKIKELRVLSRTSSEKYRNSPKTAPEIAQELNVTYIVEGSGQKIGDEIQLHIQLIDASTDKHLWAKNYQKHTRDIFQLQKEVAKSIAEEIEVVITPEEVKRIEKIPTENLTAYDFYLKGLEYLNQGEREPLFTAIEYFEKAVQEDPKFALAYANMAIAFYYLDAFQSEKKYMAELNSNADKAMLLDPELSHSLMAKYLVYIQSNKFSLAVPFLEKALEYSPNSSTIINMLSDYYANVLPNTEKYLEYALKGIRLDIAGKDSTSASYLYLHLSNALIQTGFTREALEYLEMVEAYNPSNQYVDYLRAFTKYPLHHDLNIVSKELLQVLEKDPTRLDVLQDVAKVFYMMEDYEKSYAYYSKLDSLRKAYSLNIYIHENLKPAFVCRELGKTQEAEAYFQSYRNFLPSDESIYHDLLLFGEQLYLGNEAKAIEHIEAFTSQKDYHYWVVLFMDKDPLLKPLFQKERYKQAMNKIEDKFWSQHEQIKNRLEEAELL